MSVQEVRTCDIYTSSRAEAKAVSVRVEINDSIGAEFDSVDMSERAIERLKRFIERGMTPIKHKAEA